MDETLYKLFSLSVDYLSHEWNLALEESEETAKKSQRLQEEIDLLQSKLQQLQSENSEIKASLSTSENQNETLQNDLKYVISPWVGD